MGVLQDMSIGRDIIGGEGAGRVPEKLPLGKGQDFRLSRVKELTGSPWFLSNWFRETDKIFRLGTDGESLVLEKEG